LIPASVQTLEQGWCSGNRNVVRSIAFAPGSTITAFGESAFAEFNHLREIIIPASVEVIGSSCFEGLGELSGVSFAQGSKLREIQSGAFSECPSLWSIALPASLETLGDSCFSDSRGIDEITFEAGSKLKEIGSNCFYRVSRMESITIPPLVEVLPSGCLSSMECLRTVKFAAGSRLKTMETNAFQDDGSLSSIAIPASVETIEDGCFWDCVALKTVTFARGSKIRRLGYRAFMNCRSLKGISLPASLEYVGKYCFGHCKAFTQITFQPGSRLSELRSLPLEGFAQLDIPDSVQILGCHGKIPERRRLVIQFGRESKLVTLAFYEKGESLCRAFVRRSEAFRKEMRKKLEFDENCTLALEHRVAQIPGVDKIPGGIPPDLMRFLLRESGGGGEWDDEEVSELDSRYGGMGSDSDYW
jgi:hypothetical protein